MKIPVALPLAVALLCTSLAGCGSENPFDMVQISGTVTYEDGSPIPGDRVVVRFYPGVKPIDKKFHPRPAQGEVKPDGTFETLTTVRYGDGVIPGPQKVVVQALDVNEQPTRAVPREYHQPHSTPLEVDISSGSEPVEIKVAKPSQRG